MIFYFTGTGNSKYVAERIAEAIGDKVQPIEDYSQVLHLKDGEAIGFVSYTAWFQIPPLMREFMTNLNVVPATDNYTFYVATYGTSPGYHGEDARRLLAKKGIRLDASFSVRQPDTWTPIFDLSDPVAVARTNERAEKEISELVAMVQNRVQGNHTSRRWPYFIHSVTEWLLSRQRQTKHFYVEDSCIGCGLCARRCPVQAITIEDKRPVWTKKQCSICLRCLHHCPKFAIQYGDGKTKKHGQYRNPHTKV